MKLTAIFKLLFKLLVTALALLIVYRTIDINKTISLLGQIFLPGLFVGFILYIISKVVSAFRLNQFLLGEGILINAATNLKLYFQGMFYNLFLPGGIGGDGYKALIFKKNLSISIKKSIRSLVLDRVSGMIALVSLSSLSYLLAVPDVSIYGNWIAFICLTFVYPIALLITRIFFSQHLPHFVRSSLYSLTVQGIQVCSALIILISMGLQNSFLIYTGLFLISSVFAVLPFTIGGVGARELTFVFASEWVGIDIDFAVAFSLIFFLINVLSSLPGVLFRAPENSNVPISTNTP